MPDASGHDLEHQLPPPRWRDAFAALPLEAAPPQAWERLRARLPVAAAAAPARRPWPLWFAAAASLALVVAVPLRGLLQDRPSGHAGTPPALAAAEQVPVPPRPSVDVPADSGPVLPPPQPRPVAETRGATRTVATTSMARRPESAQPRSDDEFEPLYAESARLEALLAVARDDRIASSGAAALTDSLDAELAVIDATLIQPGLDAPRRAGLWRQRVETLRQLAGIETTRRLLSARGETYDAALVSID